MLLTKISCPHCDAVIKPSAGVEIGKKIVCPKCREPFVAASPGTTKKTPVSDEEEDRGADRRSSARSPKRVARSRQEDRESEEQEEDSEQQDSVAIPPRTKKKGKKKKRQTAPSLLLPGLLIAFALLLLAGGGIGFYLLSRKAPTGDAPVPAGWGEVVAAQGHFRALMPQPVVERSRTMASSVGPVRDYQYLHETDGVNLGYSITYADFSPTQIEKASLEQIIDAGRDEMLKQYTGQVEVDKKIERDGRRGREVVISVPGRGRFLMHYYIADTRLYTLTVVGPKASLDSKEARTFFDAFRLLDAKR